MAGKKSTAKEIAEMKYTQPKMVRVIDGAKGGKGVMVVDEPSQRDKDARIARQSKAFEELRELEHEWGLNDL